MPKNILKDVKLNEISGVDVPAHAGALTTIMKSMRERTPEQVDKDKKLMETITAQLEKSDGEVTEEIQKNISGLSWYIMIDIRNQQEVLLVVAMIDQFGEDVLPLYKSVIMTRASQLAMDMDELPDEGFFASISTESVVKARNPSTNGKEDDMSKSKTEEALEKENSELKARLAKLEKSQKESSIADENEALRKRVEQLEASGADAALEKRASEYSNMNVNVVKRMLKSIDAIEDEAEREAALKELKAQNDAVGKRFEPVGDAGQSATEREAVTKAVDEELEKGTDLMTAFAKADSNWDPRADVAPRA